MARTNHAQAPGGHVPGHARPRIGAPGSGADRPGARRRRRQPRPRWPLGGAARRSSALHLIGIDRDPTAIELPRAARRLRRPDHAGPRGLRRAARGAGPPGSATSTACCSTWASPRRNWTRPNAGSPTPMTRRWTCGWTGPRAHRGRGASTPTRPRELIRILRDYGEERFAPRVARRIIQERAQEPITSTKRLAEIVRDGDPSRHPADRGQPRQENFPGAAHRGQRGARRPGARAPRGARRAGARRADRRALVPLPGGPARQAGPRGANQGHRPPRAARPAAGSSAAVPPGDQGSRAPK